MIKTYQFTHKDANGISGVSFASYGDTQEMFTHIISKLNELERKSIEYKTSYDVFHNEIIFTIEYVVANKKIKSRHYLGFVGVYEQ